MMNKKLYDAINAMMAQLGAMGEIGPRDATVTAVMDALHDIDGGVWTDTVTISRDLLAELIKMVEASGNAEYIISKMVAEGYLRQQDYEKFEPDIAATIERAKKELEK